MSESPNSETPKDRSWFGFLVSPKFLSLGLLFLLVVTLALQTLNNPRRALERGMEAVQKKDTAKVAAAIRDLEGYPNYVKQSDFLRAFLAVQDNELEKGLRLALEAQKHPDVAMEAAVLAGEAAYKLGAPGNAKLLWENVLLEDPESVAAHQWLGVLFYDIGAMNDAIYHLEEVSRLRPEDPRPDRLMGLMNRDYERPEIAIRYYKETLKRAPEQADADQVRLELAECHIKLREFDEALLVLEQCKPTPRRNLFIVRCRLNLGMLDDVRSLAASLIESDGQEPADGNAEMTEALQLNAEIALADGNPEKAAELLRRAVDSDSFSHSVRTQYAQVLGRLGKTDESREQTKVAGELQARWQKFSDLQIDAINVPTDPEIRCEIGRLAKELGKPKLAAVWFKAALGIDPTNRSAAAGLAELAN